ncbi:glycosyltransferase [Ferruginibacter albus]|uniref:glycosyltransferase n=1 Tax=Ferruginibacter albus TaxID=2875540 RepID=UPI001CC7E4BD|nr:glycosyltransferase [Ferruginibacter albus]UAY51917.1 glycosyltransferase [Ferruginibacter albus]
MATSQIFQTNNAKRWKGFKWSIRIVLIIFCFFLVVLTVALVRGVNPSLPSLLSKSKEYQEKLDPTNPLTIVSNENKKYKGFKDELYKKKKEDSIRNSHNNTLIKKDVATNPYIRAAFYTPWVAGTSYPDLVKNGNRLNTIFPEWFFIDSNTFTLKTRIDTAGYNLMRKQHLRILPILNNYRSRSNKFDGGLLHLILNDPDKRTAFINQLVDTLQHYNLQGINIDFESIQEKTNTPLTAFQKQLYETLHAKNLTVTMDVSVMNDAYDYKKLSDYNDYIILMAYDQHSPVSEAGPISAQKWIEEALDWTAKQINPDKIILGFAGYGYDWYKTVNGKDTVKGITYSEALNKAKVLGAPIDYNNDNYNLTYSYVEGKEDDEGEIKKIKHEVWFTDAATTFNILRFSDEYATAGTVLWRLGGEDQRIWTFYDRDLSTDALAMKPYDFGTLETIPISPDNVHYEGEGEVLNIIGSPIEGKLKLEIDSSEMLISEQNYVQLPSGYIIQKFAEDTTAPGPGHKMVLTFDDGPDPRWTPAILDILEKNKIPATFFVVGIQAEKNIPILQRINKDGFEIGNHTFTHSNVAKMSVQRAELEMKLTRLLIESITGRSTILFRAPYNADSEPHTYEELAPIERSRKDNYITIGESIDPEDWQPNITADTIYQRVIRMAVDRGASIILLHDAGGDTRQATIEALPRIIDYFRSRGYEFTTVAHLMGKTKDDVMPKIPATRDGWLIKLNFFFAETTFWGSNIVFSLFMVGIALSVGRILVMAILAFIQRKREAKGKLALAAPLLQNNNFPKVSIIVPAYNEEVNAIRTVKSLLVQDYPNLHVIFVDDGSKDSTYETVRDAFMYNNRVSVYSKPNGGKASALNYGIEKCDNDFVVCIDADTQLKKDAVSQLMKKFDAEGKVGAVAGNVKVGNEINMITRWQSIEYITSQNFDRRAFDLLNCITVVPGAIGAFRKQAIIDAGGFTIDTLAEDCDLTMRMLRNNYIIRNCTEAMSFTEAPETTKQFLKQRFRWSFGVMQCFWKHRDAVFNRKYKNFGMIALPNILVFQMILPFLAPLADLVLVVSLIAAGLGIIPASIEHIILYYFIFTLVDVAGAALAFAFEKEDYCKLIWLIPQRLVYRQLMYYILIKSFNKAIKGELQGWGVLKRTGNVKQVAAS